MTIKRHISHIKSKSIDNETGKPKLPSSESIELGEIAINFAEHVETISLKNESGTVVPFSSDEYYAKQKLGSAFTGSNVSTVTDELNSLETRKANLSYVNDKLGSAFTGSNSGNTVTGKLNDLNNYVDGRLGSAYTGVNSGNTVTSKWNELDTKKSDLSAFTEHTASTSHMNSTEKTNLDSLATNIAAISGISSSDVQNWNGKADQTAFTAHTANTTVHITAAERTAWNAKADKTYVDDKLGSGFTGANSGVSVTEVLEEEMETIAAAITDLEDRKADNSDLAAHTANTSIHVTSSDKNNWNGKADQTAFTAHTASTVHMNSTEKTNLDSLATNIAAISGISASDVQNWNGKADQTAFTAHTANTTVHITAAERSAWNAKSDKTYVDEKLGSAFTGSNSGVSVTQYLVDNEYTVSTALNDLERDKVENSTFNAHTASTVHMNSTEKTNLDSLATNIGAISGITSGNVNNWNTAYGKVSGVTNFNVLSGITSGNVSKWDNAYSSTSALDISALSGINSNDISDWNKAAEVASKIYNNADVLGDISGEDVENWDNASSATSALDISALSGINSNDISEWNNAYSATSALDISALSGIDSNDINDWNNAVDVASKINNNADVLGNISSGDVENWDKTYSATSALDISALSGINSNDISEWDKGADTANVLANNLDVLSGISSSDVSNWNGKADNSAFTAHTANTTVHITAAERTAWNAKADKEYVDDKLGSGFTGANSGVSVTEVLEGEMETIAAAITDLEDRKADNSDLAAHTANTSIHVTSSDKNNWNAKAENSALTAHTANTTVHMTSTEKTNIDSLATNIAAISGITSQDIANWNNGASSRAYVDEKLGSAFTGANSGVSVTEYIVDNEYAISTALNNMEDQKADKEYVDEKVEDVSFVVARGLTDLNNRIAELEAKLNNLLAINNGALIIGS